MWPLSTIDVENVNVVLDRQKVLINKPLFDPSPYTFTKIENGKKITADVTSLSPPTWLLLDHTVSVIWSLFSSKVPSHQLNLDDLKWAYEFLKKVKNKKGEIPPDVKVCLKKIQDRLINLYAGLTSIKANFDDIAAAFGERIIEDSASYCINTTFTENKMESQMNSLTLSSSKNSPSYLQIQGSLNDITHPTNKSNQHFPLLEEDSSDPCEEPETEDEEVEKCFLSLLQEDKKIDPVDTKPNTKSLIPTKKKKSQMTPSEPAAVPNPAGDVPKREKTSKRVVAEMRSVKVHKSMKVHDTNGEEAYSNSLKAEIKKLSFNPNVSKKEMMKFLMDYKLERVDRLNNELKRLGSIEEFMKNLNKVEPRPTSQDTSTFNTKDLTSTKSSFTVNKSVLL